VTDHSIAGGRSAVRLERVVQSLAVTAGQVQQPDQRSAAAATSPVSSRISPAPGRFPRWPGRWNGWLSGPALKAGRTRSSSPQARSGRWWPPRLAARCPDALQSPPG